MVQFMAAFATTLLLLASTNLMPATAHENVTAAVFNDITQKYYFFFDDGQYVSKKRGEDVGNAKSITDFAGNFPESWDKQVDSVVFNSNTRIYYFFKHVAATGWEYISKPFGAGEDFSEPKNMNRFAKNNFNDLDCAIDASVYDPIAKIYYFFKKDGSFCSKDQGNNDVIQRQGAFGTNYPRDFVLGAVTLKTTPGEPANSYYYFFSHNTYVRKKRGYSFGNKKDTRQDWKGWPAEHGLYSPTVPVDLNLPEALFTEPELAGRKQVSLTIKNSLLALINAAEEEIVIHIYSFKDEDIQQALLKAHWRGVRVTMLIDQNQVDADPSSVEDLDQGAIDHFQTIDLPRDGDGEPYKLHNKLGLFRKVRTNLFGDIECVVFTTSMNFRSGSYKKFQDALIFSDEAIYDGFMKQTRNIQVANTDYIPSIKGGTNGMRAYFFPRQSVDTVADIINNLLKNHGDVTQMTIRITMGSWSESRPEVTKALKTVASLPGDAGKVDIVASGWKGGVSDRLLQGLARDFDNITFQDLPKWRNAHSKYMLVDVAYNTGKHYRITYAGTENLTGFALKYNYEYWIKIINDSIYDSYMRNFQEMSAMAP